MLTTMLSFLYSANKQQILLNLTKWSQQNVTCSYAEVWDNLCLSIYRSNHDYSVLVATNKSVYVLHHFTTFSLITIYRHLFDCF